jgi:hypothetical protein
LSDFTYHSCHHQAVELVYEGEQGGMHLAQNLIGSAFILSFRIFSKIEKLEKPNEKQLTLILLNGSLLKVAELLDDSSEEEYCTYSLTPYINPT